MVLFVQKKRTVVRYGRLYYVRGNATMMYNNNGFIKLYRDIQNWAWYQDANTFRVFIELLLRASYKPREFRTEKLQEGQCVFGRTELAERLGISEQAVRTALLHLQETGEISLKSTNKYTVVTIENWGLYQGEAVESNQQTTNKQPTTNQQTTNKQPTTNQQLTTNKKGIKKESNKGIKEEGNKNIYIAEIIDYLNNKIGSAYKSNSANTIKHINARLKEGFTVNDFITVIDNQYEAWNGTEMAKYLRPETLFGTKFESYLNAPFSKRKYDNDTARIIEIEGILFEERRWLDGEKKDYYDNMMLELKQLYKKRGETRENDKHKYFEW